MEALTDAKEWAREQLATASFGNARRRMRCESMLRRAAERPAGRLTEVFDDAAELQAAYNFVEGSVAPEAIVGALAEATLRAACDDPFVYVPVDGSSLSLTDRSKSKDFGSIGMRAYPTRGLKVIDAIAVDPHGTPLGLLALRSWARGAKKPGSRWVRRRDGDTEMQHWVQVIDQVADNAKAAKVTPWFVIDREGDCGDILRSLTRSEGLFTVRVAQHRRHCIGGGKRGALIKYMGRRPVLGTHFVDLPRGPQRSPRVAALEVRIGRVTLDLPDHRTGQRTPLEVHIVWASERHPPRGQEALDWMLLTNRPVHSPAHAVDIIESYCHRWRIEDFHRTWKRGHCRVEDTQLRSRDHVVRWAIMLAAVALRVERLKHLARTQPDSPATVELSPMEIDALRAAKRTRFKKRTETITDAIPSISTAVFWIAQFGGFQGKTAAHAGATTIGRGLQKLLVFAAGFAAARKISHEH
jgi:hypothetical protein